MADLEADVEPPEDEEYEFEGIAEQTTPPATANGLLELSAPLDDSSGSNESDHSDNHQPSTSLPRIGSILDNREVDEDLADLLSQTALGSPSPLADDRQAHLALPGPSDKTQPITITQAPLSSRNVSDPIGARSMTPTTHTQFALAPGPVTEGPVTPRNDAGPFLLDGQRGRDGSLAVQPVADLGDDYERHARGKR